MPASAAVGVDRLATVASVQPARPRVATLSFAPSSTATRGVPLRAIASAPSVAGETQRDEQMLRLLDRAPQVVLRMHDQMRRLDVLRIGRRGPLDPGIEVVVEERAELAGEGPEEVARPVGGDKIVDSALGAGRL